MHKILLLTAFALALTGCVHHPTLSTDKFAAPRSVAIVQPPPMHNAALISLAGLAPDFHFTQTADYFFEVDPNAPASPSQQYSIDGRVTPAMPHNVGTQMDLIGALINGNAEDTQRKAEQFHAEVTKRFPQLDLRAEVTEQLRQRFLARGIQATVLKDSANVLPRLRWPAPGVNAIAFPVAPGPLPTVDADIVLQVSPVAFYAAPGPMNNYRVRATIGVAAYDGRTKQFLGMQAFRYNPDAWRNEFTTYSGLVDGIPVAVDAMREGLMSLVPEIVDTVSKQQR